MSFFRTLFCSFQNNISKNITFVCPIEDKDDRWGQLEDTQSQNSYISALLKFVAWDFLIFRNFCGNWFLLRYLFEAERGYSLCCFFSRTAKFANFLPGKNILPLRYWLMTPCSNERHIMMKLNYKLFDRKDKIIRPTSILVLNEPSERPRWFKPEDWFVENSILGNSSL